MNRIIELQYEQPFLKTFIYSNFNGANFLFHALLVYALAGYFAGNINTEKMQLLLFFAITCDLLVQVVLGVIYYQIIQQKSIVLFDNKIVVDQTDEYPLSNVSFSISNWSLVNGNYGLQWSSVVMKDTSGKKLRRFYFNVTFNSFSKISSDSFLKLIDCLKSDDHEICTKKLKNAELSFKTELRDIKISNLRMTLFALVWLTFVVFYESN